MARTDRRRFPSHRRRWAVGVALLFGLVAWGAPQVAQATDPIILNGAYVVDRVGVLGPRLGEVQRSLDELSGTAGINLFVVYVDEFTGVSDRKAWADETAVRNQLGVSDILLAIATGDRLYQVSVDPDFPLSDEQLSELETTSIQPSLRQNDWAGAAVNAASGLGELAAGRPVPAPVITPGSAPSSSGSGSTALAWGLGGAVVVTAGIVGVVFLRRRSGAGSGTAAAADRSQAELDRDVGRLLVQLDDAVTNSEQELGFAVAQFGEQTTSEFSNALASAKDKVRQSFALKQNLDDHTPDTPEDRRAWSLKIIELCQSAESELDAQTDAFNALRELERNPQPSLDAIDSSIRQVQPRIATASAALQAAAGRFSPDALATVSGNPAQAGQLLAFAATTAASVSEQIAAGRTAEAAVSIRRAQGAVAQAAALLGAVDTLGADLEAAAANLSAAISDAGQDLADARALLATPEGAARQSELTPLIQDLEQRVARAAASGPGNPLAGLQTLQAGNAPLDRALAGAREQAAQAARTRDQLARALASASSAIGSVKEYVVTRRGAVSVDARTRIAEAERRLDSAYGLQQSDPGRALDEAVQANRFAQAADQAARSDVEGYTAYANQGGGRPGIDTSAVLGGLLGGLLAGGGTRRSSGGGLFGGAGGWSGSGGSPGWGGGAGGRSGSGRSSGGRRGGGGRF